MRFGLKNRGSICFSKNYLKEIWIFKANFKWFDFRFQASITLPPTSTRHKITLVDLPEINSRMINHLKKNSWKKKNKYFWNFNERNQTGKNLALGETNWKCNFFVPSWHNCRLNEDPKFLTKIFFESKFLERNYWH